MKKLISYWENDYDMKSIEKKYNSIPFYRVKAGKAEIYFNRTGSEEFPKLLLLHGWTDSSLGFFRAAEKLESEFDVIIPAMPGFGPGGPLKDYGLMDFVTSLMDLMSGITEEKFYIHGEDMGAAVGRAMAVMHPDRIAGFHTIMLNHAAIKSEDEIEGNDKRERESLEASERYQNELMGYAVVQSTKPQDLAYAFNDLPSGLMAWIASQFLSWKDPDIEIDREDLTDTAMVYWVNETMPGSMRYYRGAASEWGSEPEKNEVATYVLSAPHHISIPIGWLAGKYDNIKKFTETEKGGHFTAREIPDILVKDLIQMKKDTVKE